MWTLSFHLSPPIQGPERMGHIADPRAEAPSVRGGTFPAAQRAGLDRALEAQSPSTRDTGRSDSCTELLLCAQLCSGTRDRVPVLMEQKC